MSVPIANEPCNFTVCGLQEENKKKIKDRKEDKLRMERRRLRSKKDQEEVGKNIRKKRRCRKSIQRNSR